MKANFDSSIDEWCPRDKVASGESLLIIIGRCRTWSWNWLWQVFHLLCSHLCLVQLLLLGESGWLQLVAWGLMALYPTLFLILLILLLILVVPQLNLIAVWTGSLICDELIKAKWLGWLKVILPVWINVATIWCAWNLIASLHGWG